MLNIYLGNYLLRQRLIDTKTLQKMLKIQRVTHLRMGVLAMHLGMMSAEQVEEVNETQKKWDAKFGEIAVQKGYLSQEDVNDLLSRQAGEGVRLAQLLLDHGIFKPVEMQEILKAYRLENNLSDEELTALDMGDPEKLLKPYIELQCQLAEVPAAHILTAYSALFMRNLVRFIDRQTLLEIENQQIPEMDMTAVCQNLQGDFPLQTAILMKQDVFCQMASKHAKMEISQMDELAAASVTEFLNLHNGLFTVWLSENGLRDHMQPPAVPEKLPDFSRDEWIKVPFALPCGSLRLLVKMGGTYLET
jgi:CheY-specific phosphatase CheX